MAQALKASTFQVVIERASGAPGSKSLGTPLIACQMSNAKVRYKC